MTEIEKARYYVKQLARGINPVTGQKIPQTDVVNDVNIVRCLFYVADILDEVKSNGEKLQKEKKPQKIPFQLDFEDRKRFEFSEDPITISEITKRINSLRPSAEMVKLKHNYITSWLIQVGFLEFSPDAEGKPTKRPTSLGKEQGIATEYRNSYRGMYAVTVYSKQAQQLILDNLDAVLAFSQGPSTKG